jgi:hypothetical protein
MVSLCGPGGTPRTAWKCGRSSIRARLTAPLGRPLLRGGGEVRVDHGKCGILSAGFCQTHVGGAFHFDQEGVDGSSPSEGFSFLAAQR